MNVIHHKNKEMISKILQHKLILMIRGHIRDSFKNNQLYNFVKILTKKYDLSIYIHTWNIKQNNISHKPLDIDNTEITEEMICKYFKECKIEKIMIDNDANIKLNGNLEGTICSSRMPYIGWKNMWYGIYRNISEIKDRVKNPTIPIVNIRFDLFEIFKDDLRYYVDMYSAYKFIINNYRLKYKKNIFIHNSEKFGIDNIIIGNVNTMYKLISHFHDNLDEIALKYPEVKSQEYLVYYENNKIE